MTKRLSERDRQFLAEMGITVWAEKRAPAEPAKPAEPPKAPPKAARPAPQVPDITDFPEFGVPPPDFDAGVYDDLPPPVDPVVSAEPEKPAPVISVENLSWGELKDVVSSCRGCALCKTRTKVVFGDGNEKARWLFVGEGPGKTEDETGLPFTGRAGELLNAMIAALGLKRDEVYIANTVKCRAYDTVANKDMKPPESSLAACRGYLKRQMELIGPDVIVALGAISSAELTNNPPGTRMRDMRGASKTLSVNGRDVPLVCTYHPAYLLRSPREKGKAWEDLCRARNLLL